MTRDACSWRCCLAAYLGGKGNGISVVFLVSCTQTTLHIHASTLCSNTSGKWAEPKCPKICTEESTHEDVAQVWELETDQAYRKTS